MDQYRVKPGDRVDLGKQDPEDTSAFSGDKKKGLKKALELQKELEELQELLFGEGRRKVLIVLQGMDTSGKDGVIRHVFEGVNPQGVKVASFKGPTPVELSHDYLWRVHPHVPGKGEIVIFNRSHYEDVLIVRVHELVPKETWSKRYDQIKDFERLLAEEGTLVLKFFLHIDRAEQKRRLEERLADTDKLWKFNPDDLAERKLWDQYEKAYEDAISKTSTKYAPWYVVPSNRKWYRNLVIGTIIVEKLKELKMSYPKPTFDPATITIDD